MVFFPECLFRECFALLSVFKIWFATHLLARKKVGPSQFHLSIFDLGKKELRKG